MNMKYPIARGLGSALISVRTKSEVMTFGYLGYNAERFRTKAQITVETTPAAFGMIAPE
jgi:hypothetical protein